MMNVTPFWQRVSGMLFAMLCGFMLHAQQLIVTEMPPTDLNVCTEGSTFLVVVTNPSDPITGYTAQNIRLLYQMPNGMEYGGNLVNATYFGTNPPNEPAFQLADLAPGQSVTVSFDARANCSLWSNSSLPIPKQNTLNIAYDRSTGGSEYYPVVTSSYNLHIATLTVFRDESTPSNTNFEFSNAYLGQPFLKDGVNSYREIQIQANGGSVDTVIVRIEAEGEIQYFNFLLGNTNLPINPSQWTYNSGTNEYILTLTGTDIGDATEIELGDPTLLEDGEKLIIYEDFSVVTCTGTGRPNTTYYVEWGCSGASCQTGLSNNLTASAENVQVKAGAPIIQPYLNTPLPVTNYCRDGDEVSFKFVNAATGTGDFATDLILELQSYETPAAGSFYYTDWTINGTPIPTGMVQAVLNVPNVNFSPIPGYRIDLTSNTTPFTGMLADWDQDGFYDDLGAGQTLILSAKIHFNSPQAFESTCPMEYYAMYGNPQAIYKGSCATQDSRAFSMPDQFYPYYVRTNNNFNGSIEGPTDMSEGQTENFRFCTGNFDASIEFMDCPVDSFFVKIILPNGYGLTGSPTGLFTGYNGWTATLQPELNLSGDTLTIEYDGSQGWQGCYDVPLTLSCAFKRTGIQMQDKIKWQLDYQCDTCDVMQHRVCDEFVVYNHVVCEPDTGGGNCEGILTTALDLQRASFGWTDYSYTTMADASTTGIQLEAAYPFDTVQSITLGTVVGSKTNFTYNYIRTDVPLNYLNWLNGRVEIWDGSTLIQSCNVTTPPTTGNNGTENFYLVETPASCNAAMQVGYSVRFYNEFQVADPSVIFSGGNKVYQFGLFRGTWLWGATMDSLTNCDEWGAKFKFYKPETEGYVWTNRVNGCSEYEINLNAFHYGGIGGDDFPNEIRPIIDFNDTIVVYIPEGSTYVSATAANVTSWDYVNDICNCANVPISPVTITPDSLVFIYNWQLADKYNQDLAKFRNNAGTPFFPTLSVKFQPECDRPVQTASVVNYGYDNYFYTFNSTYLQERSWTQDRRNQIVGGELVNTVINNPLPNLTISTGTFVQDAFENTVEWTVEVCNRTSATSPQVSNAPYTWLDADNFASNLGNITVSNVYALPSNTPLNVTNYMEGTDENSLLELGNIPANACRSFKLEGTYTDCADVVDSLDLNLGWSCTGYPLPLEADTADCEIAHTTLGVRYKLANLNMTMINRPTSTVGICDTVQYIIQLESTGPAYMYDVNSWVNMPTGAQIVSADYLYPNPSSTIWKPLSLTNTAFSGTNPVGWNLSSIVTEWIAANGGFVGNQYPDSNKILVRMDFALNCETNGLEPFIFNTQAITNCNDTLNITDVQPLTISGFEDADKFKLIVSMPDSTLCENTVPISISYVNIGSTFTTHNDTLTLYVPQPLAVLLATGTNQTQSVIGGTNVIWEIPAGLPPNDTVHQTVFVYAPMVDSCTEFIPEGIITYRAEALCNGELCTPIGTIAQDTAKTIVCCSDCNITAEWIADTVCYKTCCNTADTTCFRLVDQATIGADYIHHWTFGDGDTSNLAEPCHVYDTVGIYIACHTVTQISTGCTETECDTVVVLPPPSGAIELLGCNPFCEGDTIYLTVNGSYTSITWVELPSGNVLGTMDTLTVTKEGRYNARLSNGYCETECLAIDVRTLPVPEIEVPDTLLCRGDSIQICAPLLAGTYVTIYHYYDPLPPITSYEVDSSGVLVNGSNCFWISDTGLYAVKVSLKNPYSCCLCSAIDTFRVRFNDLTVHVPDLTICEGTTDTLCATVSGGIPAYSYVWQPGGDTTQCILVNSAGDYIVRVTDAMGCVAIDTGHVYVDSLPNAEFSYQDTVCINDTICFVPVQFDGTHYWYVTDSLNAIIQTSNDTTFCYHFPHVGTFEVTHILTNACGSDTVTHIIEVVPPVDACIVLIGQNPFCQGDTVLLTVADQSGRTFTVNWYLNDVLIYTGDTLIVTEGGTYRAIVTDQFGCVNECMCIILTQLPAPVVDLPDNVSICPGRTAVLDAGAGFTSYVWYRNNVFFAFGTQTITATTQGVYRVEVETADGCRATDSTVVVNIMNFIPIASSSTVICRNDPFTIFTMCNNAFDYEWFQATSPTGPWIPIPASDTCRLAQTGSDLLGANTWYRVEITDPVSGCFATANIRIRHQENNCDQIALFPNPALGDEITMDYDLIGTTYNNVYAEFRNSVGAVVASYPIDVNVQQAVLNIAALSNGSYRISLIADGETLDMQHVIIAR